MRNKIRDYIFVSRSREIVSNIFCCVGNGNVLDVGCGNGYIANLLNKKIKDVDHQSTKDHINCIDVKNYIKVNLPFKIYDGHKFPYDDNSFDVVLFIYVLHHTSNQEELLKEAMRVTRNKILIVEDTYKSKLKLIWLKFLDFSINKTYHNVKTPLNFRTREQWGKLFNLMGLKNIITKNLQIGLLGKLGIEKTFFCLEVNKK